MGKKENKKENRDRVLEGGSGGRDMREDTWSG